MLKLPRLSAALAVIDAGKATASREFSRFWDQVMTAIEGAITAITDVKTTVNGVTAAGHFSVNDVVPPDGTVLARVALQVSATAGGPPNVAALFLDAMATGKTRITAEATDFVFDVENIITDGGLETHKFADSSVSAPQSIHYALIGNSGTQNVEFNVMTGHVGATYIDLGVVPATGFVTVSVTGYIQRNPGRDPVVTVRIYRGIFGTGSPVKIFETKCGGANNPPYQYLLCDGDDLSPGQYYSATLEGDASTPNFTAYDLTFRAKWYKK